MSVSGLTSTGDWQFGKGRALYLTRSDEINQNVVTRLRSFTDDWFLDISEGMPWIELLGTKGTEARILREVENRVLATRGVRKINRLRIVGIDTDREANIELRYTDIFNEEIDETVPLP